MNIPDYHIFTLDNGLKCVHERSDSAAGYCGLVINAGSRDESECHNGLAHFVEHSLFKGTKSRKSWHISNRMESIGGELNAYTTKEETMIYSNFPDGYASRSIELIADIVRNSVFPEKELEKEREVVIDEINSYLDSPADSVYDEFEELLFAGSRLAHNILGTPESVRNLNSANCCNFIEKFYAPGNMALYCSDSSSHIFFERIANKYFGSMHFPVTESLRHNDTKKVESFDKKIKRGGHQAHTVIGTKLFDRKDSRRYALFLLNNYLGGPCMNSRLNQELREKRGYVYTVDSSVGLLSDTGSIQIYFGCDDKHTDTCCRIVKRQLEEIANCSIKPRVFNKIKTQYIGQLTVSADHRESRAMSLGKSLLCYGKIHDMAYTKQRLMEVTSDEVAAVAGLIISQGLNSLTIC